MLLSVFIVECTGSAHNGRNVPVTENERATAWQYYHAVLYLDRPKV